ncbi:MAG: dehypoxanthine futalosine cyclase [Acidobacteria bacterium]|nr:dehypoxanthine futalosine cyclase [Acidobacteriota bacterium]MBI3658522.1 dehypoxanthine futalosine cyclase [Acidobacteriota bacterium]
MLSSADKIIDIARGGDLTGVYEKVLANQRLSFADGLALFSSVNLPQIGMLANIVRERKHTGNVVTFLIGRNINYTNVCWVRCQFCAFYRPPGSDEGYVLSRDQIFEKIRELLRLGGTEVFLQGGLNPKLKLDYYIDLFRAVKAEFPVHLHSLSPAEVLYISHLSRLSLEETISRLRAAGLDSIPGAGAEILIDEVRKEISPLRDEASEWLRVMRTAHQLGMPTTATMTFGLSESHEHRLQHLIKIRELQDETGGFTSFTAWNYQPDGAQLDLPRATAFDYLKTQAIARLMLDNVANIQVSWLTQGAKIGQVALKFGANDFGSTIFEENVITAASVTKCILPIPEIRRLIQDAGYEPRQRNTRYEIIG